MFSSSCGIFVRIIYTSNPLVKKNSVKTGTVLSLTHRTSQRGHWAFALHELAVAGLLFEFSVVEEDLAAEEGHPGTAGDLPALEQGVAGVAQVVSGGDDAVDAWVEDEKVGVGSGLNHTLAGVEAEDAGPGFPP